MANESGTPISCDLDWLISVDDHVIEPANVWQDRVPAKFQDAAPKLVSDDDMDYWEFDGRRAPTSGLSVAAGRTKEEFSPHADVVPRHAPGCYDSHRAARRHEPAGVLASLCFPSFPRFCGQAFSEIDDAELGMACIQAYNDWMIEEWCGSAPGRYIPLVIIPLSDPAAARGRDRAVRGEGRARARVLRELRAARASDHPRPGRLLGPRDAGVPTTTTIVVCMHVGSSSTLPAHRRRHAHARQPRVGRGAHRGAMLDWLFCDYFDRMPNLKIALSEGNIGWIPYFLERAEQVVDKQRHWVHEA